MSLYAILGFLAAVSAHALVMSGVLLSTQILTGLFIALIPVFVMSVLTHPTCRLRFFGASAEIDERKLPRWIWLLQWAAILYGVVLWLRIGYHRFHISGALDQGHQLVATWTPAILFVAVFALRWTARQLVVDP